MSIRIPNGASGTTYHGNQVINLGPLGDDVLVTQSATVRIEAPSLPSVYNIALPDIDHLVLPNGGDAWEPSGAQRIHVHCHGAIGAAKAVYFVSEPLISNHSGLIYYGSWVGSQTSGGGYVFEYSRTDARWYIVSQWGTVSPGGAGILA